MKITIFQKILSAEVQRVKYRNEIFRIVKECKLSPFDFTVSEGESLAGSIQLKSTSFKYKDSPFYI